MTMTPERVAAEWRVTARLDGGEVHWRLLQREQGPGGAGWREYDERTTAVPPNGYYEDSALSWMREHRIDPNLVHVALALPDGDEWIRLARCRPAR